LNASCPDARRLVILPSYNSGELLESTVRDVLAVWRPVWVVIDGSTDGSGEALAEWAGSEPGLRVIRLTGNKGKGAASLVAMGEALSAGFTHALLMDADGQHPAGSVREFMGLSAKNPGAMILGVPVFGADAPLERVKGRRVGNWFAGLETLWAGVRDSLFGFRLYPLAAAVRVMDGIRTARRFDFDTELAVRMCWDGVEPVNRAVPVRYPPRSGGGITHFRYVRDNLLLVTTHTRLCLLLLPRLARVWQLRRKWLSRRAPSSSPDA